MPSEEPPHPPRLTMRYVFGEAWRQFVEIDTPMLRTLFGLLFRPGAVARGYLGIDRGRYASPLKTAVITGGLYVVIALWLLPQSSVDPTLPGVSSYADPDAMARAANFQSASSHFTSIFGVPAMATANWLVFRQAKLTLAEHHAVAFLALGGVFVCACILVPFAFLLPAEGNARPIVIGLINFTTLFCYAPICLWRAMGGRWFISIPLGLISCVFFVIAVQVVQIAALFGAYGYFKAWG